MAESSDGQPSNWPIALILAVFLALVVLVFVIEWGDYSIYVSQVYFILQLLAIATYVVSGIVFFQDSGNREEFEPHSPLALLNVSEFGPLVSIMGEFIQVTFLIHISFLLVTGIGLNHWNHNLVARNYAFMIGISILALLIAFGSWWTRIQFIRREWSI